MDLASNGAASFGVSGPSLGMPTEKLSRVLPVGAFTKAGKSADTTAVEPMPTIKLRLDRSKFIVDTRPLESPFDKAADFVGEC